MVNWRAPLLDSKKDISTVMRLNNIRQATIDDILTDIRNGTNQRPNFSEHDGVLHFTDRQGRREVVALESRDAVMQELYEQHGIGMSIGRFHTLISRDYCNISRHKVEDWYANSESHQIMKTAQNNILIRRPIVSSRALGFLEIDLCDYSNFPSNGYKWQFTLIDVYS